LNITQRLFAFILVITHCTSHIHKHVSWKHRLKSELKGSKTHMEMGGHKMTTKSSHQNSPSTA